MSQHGSHAHIVHFELSTAVVIVFFFRDADMSEVYSISLIRIPQTKKRIHYLYSIWHMVRCCRRDLQCLLRWDLAPLVGPYF